MSKRHIKSLVDGIRFELYYGIQREFMNKYYELEIWMNTAMVCRLPYDVIIKKVTKRMASTFRPFGVDVKKLSLDIEHFSLEIHQYTPTYLLAQMLYIFDIVSCRKILP